MAKEGFELVFKSKSRFYDWSKLKMLNMAKSDQISAKKDLIASVSLQPRGGYLISHEIGQALDQAYKENIGKQAPNAYCIRPKKGAFTAEEFNSLKYERPDLSRRNILVSAAMFANGILLFINLVLNLRIILLAGIVILIVLMFMKLQIAKEMKEHVRNGRSPPSS